MVRAGFRCAGIVRVEGRDGDRVVTCYIRTCFLECKKVLIQTQIRVCNQGLRRYGRWPKRRHAERYESVREQTIFQIKVDDTS